MSLNNIVVAVWALCYFFIFPCPAQDVKAISRCVVSMSQSQLSHAFLWNVGKKAGDGSLLMNEVFSISKKKEWNVRCVS